MHSRNFDVTVAKGGTGSLVGAQASESVRLGSLSFLGNSQASWHSHFADEDIEAQRGEMTGSGPHNQ